jgi:dTDP-4-dehydrorhamnose reductase
MNILLFGKDGQLGQEFLKELTVWVGASNTNNLIAVGRAECDLSEGDSIRALIQKTKPKLIINTAAYTAVDLAETHQELARLINSVAPGVMAEEAKWCNAAIVHYSTDYVFDGVKEGSYLETDDCNPQSVYGTTKLMGEQRVRENCPEHLILRTSWVFSASGSNFLKTILQLAKTKKELRIINDQCGAPTNTSLIVQTTLKILRENGILHDLAQNELNSGARTFNSKPNWGTFNLVASGKTSWHGYAQYLIQKAIELGMGADFLLGSEHILPIPSSQYVQAAKRPLNSLLNTNKLSTTFGVTLENWQTLVDSELYKIQAINK